MKEGWEIKRLDEVCEFGNGLWTGKKPPFQNVGVIRNTNFTKDGKLDDNDIVYLDVEQSQFAKRKLQYGDIILEKSGGGPKQPVGRVILFNKKKGDFSYSNFTSVIRIANPNAVDFTYLHRFLFFSYVSGATEAMQSHSTGIRNLKFDDYKAIEIPIPPLPEQQRIVALLDEAFAAIAKAKANAEQNLRSAKELFQSTFNSFTADKLFKFNCLTVADVVNPQKGSMRTGPFGSQLLHGEFVEEGIAVLGIDNAVANEFQWRERRFITNEKFQQLKKFQVKPGDVLITIMGTCGRCAIVPENIPIAINTKHLCCITLDPKKCLPEYLHYYFLFHPIAQNYLKKKAKGAIMAGLNMGIIKEMPLILPPIKTQQIFVQKLQILSSNTKRLETVYQQKINDLEELKKSVLQKAFSGELKTKELMK